MLFVALSQPYFDSFDNTAKQIVIIDNSGSQSARSSILESRLDRSLNLVRKHLSGVNTERVNFYLWNQDLELIEFDGGLQSLLNRVSASHLPDGDFVTLLNSIKSFREQGFQVAFFTDALSFDRQSSLDLLGVETFFSAQENRNIFFESISHSLIGNSEIELSLILGCTAFGGNTKIIISNDKVILMEKKIELKHNDRKEIKLRVEVTPEMDHLIIEHQPQEADNLKQDNTVMYLLSSKRLRVNFSSFKANKPDLIFLRSFFNDSSTFENVEQSPDIQFVAVNKIPLEPQSYTIFVLQGESNFSEHYDVRSQAVEAEHPLLKYIDGTRFGAASYSLSAQTETHWKSIVQIKGKDSGQSVPGVLVHSENNSCLALNLAFTNRYLGNFDYLILLENISRYMRELKQRRTLIEVGDFQVYKGQILDGKPDPVSSQQINRISVQGLYKSADGFNFFARFPVRESKLEISERVTIPDRFFNNSTQNSSKFDKKVRMSEPHDAYWSSILIFLALILMIVEWYVFSKRA